jgi:hypothetical protein
VSEKPTALDAVKIQARAVIPIMRALEREMGEERAHAVVGRAIAESHAEWQAKAVSTRNSHPRDNDIEEQLPIKTEVVEDTDYHLRDQHDEMRIRGALPRDRSSRRRGAAHLRRRLRDRGGAPSRLGVSLLPNHHGRREPM